MVIASERRAIFTPDSPAISANFFGCGAASVLLVPSWNKRVCWLPVRPLYACQLNCLPVGSLPHPVAIAAPPYKHPCGILIHSCSIVEQDAAIPVNHVPTTYQSGRS